MQFLSTHKVTIIGCWRRWNWVEWRIWHRGHLSSGIWRCVTGKLFPDVSRSRGGLIFKCWNASCLITETTTSSRKVVDQLPSYLPSYGRRTRRQLHRCQSLRTRRYDLLVVCLRTWLSPTPGNFFSCRFTRWLPARYRCDHKHKREFASAVRSELALAMATKIRRGKKLTNGHQCDTKFCS